MNKIKGLDTLRAFAVFFVFMQHLGVWYDDSHGIGKIIRIVIIPGGGLGVHLFFVLSGFLITSILLNAKNNHQATKPISIIKNFFIRRSLRIFPIYYLLIFILFLCKYPDLNTNIWYYITYTVNFLCFHTNQWNNFSHTWTLDIEEQFYILWPWLVILVNNKYFNLVAISAIIIGVASTYYNQEIGGHMAPFMVFNCMDAFGIGALYAGSRILSNRHKRSELLIKILAVISLAIYFLWNIDFYTGSPHIVSIFLAKTVNSLIAVWLIMLVVNNKSARMEKYFLGNRFLNYIGKISYGIYLYHYVYINGLNEKVNSSLSWLGHIYPAISNIVNDRHVVYWIHIACIILISSVSYKLVEQPLLNIKDKFFKLSKAVTR